jgi:hypothetical protein
MNNDFYFVKSLEEDFHTKTLKDKRKVNFQSVQNMIRTKVIHPNTKSFGRESRLSTTILNPNYLKTYRPQGIIFKTRIAPSYILPFDLVVLSDAKKIVVHYYRIKDNLHFYYNHELIPGFERFVFRDFAKLITRFPTHQSVWKEVNAFRSKAGYKRMPLTKWRLIEYNEAVFERPIQITPVAIFGYGKNARAVARQFALPHFRTAKDFYKKVVTAKA